jgi:hypothetical protein
MADWSMGSPKDLPYLLIPEQSHLPHGVDHKVPILLHLLANPVPWSQEQSPVFIFDKDILSFIYLWGFGTFTSRHESQI